MIRKRCLLRKVLRPVLIKIFSRKKVNEYDMIFSLGYFLTRTKTGAYLFLLKTLVKGKGDVTDVANE